MGFNFQAGHPADVLRDADLVVEKLKARFGVALPLGQRGRLYCLPNELAWSWWGELQTFAREKLGEAATVQMHAADAWCGAYVDAAVNYEIIRISDHVPKPRVISFSSGEGAGVLGRIRRFFGFERKNPERVAFEQNLQRIVEDLGAEKGSTENSGVQLQVGNLRGLVTELEAVLRLLGTPPNATAVESLLASYSPVERCDDDGHVQCLCHAWLTATHAVSNGCPLWLVK